MNPLLKIFPPVWFALFLALGLGVHYYVPSARVFDVAIPGVTDILALVLAIAAFYVSQYASFHFAKVKTEILPTSETNCVLVVEGPYRFTRNPMYLGLVILLLAVAIYIGTLPLVISAFGLFLVFNFFFIPFEEAKMLRQFGAEYEEYRARVRRWL